MVLYWAKVVALSALVIFLGFGSYFFWTLNQSTKQITQSASSTFAAANAAIDNINSASADIGKASASIAYNAGTISYEVDKTFNGVNRQCIPGPCGTLSDVAKTLNTIRGTFGEVQIAANHEDKNLTYLDSQEVQLFSDMHLALAGFPVMENNIDKTISDIDALSTSPDLIGSIHNFNTISYNFGQTTGDFQNKFHSFLYPPPCKNFKCHIRGIYEGIKIGSELTEPVYYGYALWKLLPPN